LVEQKNKYTKQRREEKKNKYTKQNCAPSWIYLQLELLCTWNCFMCSRLCSACCYSI